MKFLIDLKNDGKRLDVFLTNKLDQLTRTSIKKIIELNSQEIIYVSCNPSTQARDIQILMEHGYAIKKFSIADQFPHTHHIETIFILIK